MPEVNGIESTLDDSTQNNFEYKKSYYIFKILYNKKNRTKAVFKYYYDVTPYAKEETNLFNLDF